MYFTPHGYEDLYGSRTPAPTTRTTSAATPGSAGWSSTRAVATGAETKAAYVTGCAREISGGRGRAHLPRPSTRRAGRPAFQSRGLRGRRRPRCGCCPWRTGRCTSAPATPPFRTGPDRRGTGEPHPTGLVDLVQDPLTVSESQPAPGRHHRPDDDPTASHHRRQQSRPPGRQPTRLPPSQAGLTETTAQVP